MKKLSALLALVLGVGLAFAVVDDRRPSQFRTVVTNSSTVIPFSRSNSFASAAAGASTSDANTFTLNAATTVNRYAGLVVKFAGSGSCATANGDVRLIKTHTATVATLDSATSDVVDPNCTYTIGPAFLSQCRVLVVGGCAATCYVSTIAGGAVGVNRMTLSASQFIALDNPGVDYLEVLGSAADVVTVGCMP